MNVILITVLVSTMTTLSSASSSAQIDNYIRIKNNYLMPLAKAASEAYNTSFDDVFKVMDYYGLNGGFCHADDILRIYYSLEPTIDAEGPVQVANTLYELDKILDLDVSLVKRTFDTYRLFADTKWITPDIVHRVSTTQHHYITNRLFADTKWITPDIV
uniref:Uncharacterized protein n=1 Tax=Timema douglasi TaxID=61478 RepID=A0A7R8VPR1_TIMDO|nr:unnamed protein product [Timema douglasi]